MRSKLWVLLLGLLLLSLQQTTVVHAGGTVGNGTPASCTNAALIAAIQNGGTVTFNCGGPITIPITETLQFEKWNTVIDGGGQVTLQGTPGTRIIYFRTWGFNASRTITLQNLTIRDASISGAGENANGAAIMVQNRSANWNNDLPRMIINNVRFENNVATLTQPTTNYAYDFGGGAIYILGGILKVNNSTFVNNTVNGGTGGAIHGLGSAIKIKNSTFTGNTATLLGNDNHSGYGGVLYVDGTLARGNGSVKIVDSIFENNTAANQGGVMYVNLYSWRNEALIIRGSRFIGNSVIGGQLGFGGVISGGGTGGPVRATIANSVFANNIARGGAAGPGTGGDGGAVAFPQPVDLTVSNSTFYNNEARINCPNDQCFKGRGGALYISGGATTFRILNNTIANNRAGWFAGAIMSSGNGTVSNNIISNNISENRGVGGNYDRQCSNAYGGSKNVHWPNGNACAGGTRFADPMLGSFTNGMMAPTSTSPALNYANVSVCAAAPVNNLDQRGVPRPQGRGCDAGSVELQGTAPQTAVLTGPAHESTGISRNPTFTWNAGPNAAAYRMVVRNGKGNVVYKVRLTAEEAGCSGDNTCTFTMSDKTLRPNKPFTWFVRTLNPFGVARSETLQFRTTP